MPDTSKELEKVRRELRRKSLDQLLIFNPLDKPFQTIYDGFNYVIQPKKEATLLRYIAVKWMKEFVDYMINQEEIDQVETENDKRRKKGWQVMTPQERDEFDIRNKLTTDNQEKRTMYMKMIYKGVSQEHGLDLPEQTAVKRDRRPQDEQLLEQLDKEMGIRETLPEDNFDLEDKKDDLLKGISDE